MPTALRIAVCVDLDAQLEVIPILYARESRHSRANLLLLFHFIHVLDKQVNKVIAT